MNRVQLPERKLIASRWDAIDFRATRILSS
jgi:hypothetical protein